MTSLVGIVVLKACAAALLGLGAAIAGRWLRRPALLHALWMVVLLELLVPPLFEIGVLPRAVGAPAAVVATIPSPTGSTNPLEPSSTVDARGPVPVASASVPPWLPPLVGGVWLIGLSGVLLLAAVRARRFGKLVAGAVDAPREMQSAARRIASTFGLRRCPSIRLVPAAISPLLRPRWGSLEILFPSALSGRLEPEERELLLAHELAHVRRRDHWVRWIELSATALFWWHPVVWWARKRLRRAEEQCCDALVLTTLPEHANSYARGLVKTVEFLAAARFALPSLASGAAGARNLEERLIMIVNHRLPTHPSRIQRVLLVVASAALLLVLPTWADPPSPREHDALQADQERPARAEADVHETLLALERRAASLEAELQEVRQQQRRIESEFAREHELPLRQRLLEAEAAEQRRELDDARQLRREAIEMQVQLEELAVRSQMRDAEREILQSSGDEREARALARELAELERQHEVSRERRELGDEMQALQRQLALLERKRADAEIEGLVEEVEALERGIDELSRAIELRKSAER